jgi:hypothetical protein
MSGVPWTPTGSDNATNYLLLNTLACFGSDGAKLSTQLLPLHFLLHFPCIFDALHVPHGHHVHTAGISTRLRSTRQHVSTMSGLDPLTCMSQHDLVGSACAPYFCYRGREWAVLIPQTPTFEWLCLSTGFVVVGEVDSEALLCRRYASTAIPTHCKQLSIELAVVNSRQL